MIDSNEADYGEKDMNEVGNKKVFYLSIWRK